MADTDTSTLPHDEMVTAHIYDDHEIVEVYDALHDGNTKAVKAFLSNLSPADTANLIAKASEEDRERLLQNHVKDIDPEAFAEMDGELRKTVLQSLKAKRVASIISALESDDALDLIIHLDDDFRQEILRKLSAKMRLTIEEGLTFPEDSAGRLMQREVVAIPEFWSAGKTVDYLREAASDLPAEFFDIFVINPTYHIKGQIPLNQLVRAKRTAKLEELSLKDAPSIPRRNGSGRSRAHLPAR